jgi:glycosyltransferase involved in cell wall biosynthesis
VADHLDLLIFNWQDRHHPQTGGAETHLHEVFGRLAARGHRVTVIASAWDGAPPRETVDGMDVHRTGSRLSYPWAARRYYKRVFGGRKFDLVVEDLNKVPLATPLWVREPIVLLVHHLFGVSAFSAASPLVAATTMLLERTLLPMYARCPIVAVSRSSAIEVQRRTHRAGEVLVIHNGIEIAEPLEARPHLYNDGTDPLFVYLGRLQRYKRVDLPIRAIARLADEDVPARLVVAGRGPEERRLRALAEELGVASRVIFRGFVSEEEKAKLLESARANVITSVKEGWGMSILDAGLLGTTTIASDSPGLRDAVRNDITGVLVPHGDVAALSVAMRRMAIEPMYAAELGEAARAHAHTFTWDAAADAFEAVLRSTPH